MNIKQENPLQTLQRIKTLSSPGYSMPECAGLIGVSVNELLNVKVAARKLLEKARGEV